MPEITIEKASEEIKSMKEAHGEALKTVKELMEKQSAELKKNGETTTKTAAGFKAIEARIDEYEKNIKGTMEDLTKKSEALNAVLNRVNQGKGIGNDGLVTPGGQVTSNENYKDMIKRKSLNMDPVEIKAFSKFLTAAGNPGAMKTLVTSQPGSAGDIIEPQVLAEIFTDPGDRPRFIRDLLSIGRTSSNAIEFHKELLFTNAAAPVVEGAVKPEAAITFEKVSVPIRTLAHWLPVTKQAIEDQSQLEAHINQRLLLGLKLQEDFQLLEGDGTGENLTGFFNTVGINSLVWSAQPVGTTKIDAIRRAITQIQKAHYPATGMILSPDDWQDIELEKTDDKQYLWVSVTEGGQQRMWRVPVVVSTAMPTGKSLLGGFTMGATLWDRENANIRVSDSHSDFFVRNQLAILAEQREALTVYRPKSFSKIDFDSAPV